MPFANHNVRHIAGTDIAIHFFPERAQWDPDPRKNRRFTVSVNGQGDMKNLVDVEEGESAMLMLDFGSNEQVIFNQALFDIAPPISFLGIQSSVLSSA